MSLFNACYTCQHCNESRYGSWCEKLKKYILKNKDTSKCPHYKDKEEGEEE